MIFYKSKYYLILFLPACAWITLVTCKPPQAKLISSNQPGENLWKTNPTKHVHDYENLYSDKEELTLDSMLSKFETKTTIEIVLLTIDSSMTSSDSLDAFTLALGNEWRIGADNGHKGIMIGISSHYQKMRIQNGYGIEKLISDKDTKVIIDSTFVTNFKSGKYFEGTSEGILALEGLLYQRLQNRAP